MSNFRIVFFLMSPIIIESLWQDLSRNVKILTLSTLSPELLAFELSIFTNYFWRSDVDVRDVHIVGRFRIFSIITYLWWIHFFSRCYFDVWRLDFVVMLYCSFMCQFINNAVRKVNKETFISFLFAGLGKML